MAVGPLGFRNRRLFLGIEPMLEKSIQTFTLFRIGKSVGVDDDDEVSLPYMVIVSAVIDR